MNEVQMDAAGAEKSPPTWGSWGREIWNRSLFEGDSSEGTPVQFGLRTILLLQAAAAGALSLLLMLDLAGVLILFVGTVLVMFWKVSPSRARRRRLLADLLAGAMLPIVCVFFDPGILRETQLGAPALLFDPGFLRGTDVGIILVFAILVQVGMLLVWQLTPREQTVAGFFAGSLSVGFVVATAIGIYILPMTLMGLLLIVGLLGTMPFLTAIVYLRNVIAARRMARARGSRALRRMLYVLGLAVAVGLPLVLYEACGKAVADYLRSLPNYGLRWL